MYKVGAFLKKNTDVKRKCLNALNAGVGGREDPFKYTAL